MGNTCRSTDGWTECAARVHLGVKRSVNQYAQVTSCLSSFRCESDNKPRKRTLSFVSRDHIFSHFFFTPVGTRLFSFSSTFSYGFSTRRSEAACAGVCLRAEYPIADSNETCLGK